MPKKPIQRISFRFIRWTAPLLILFLSVLAISIYSVENKNQEKAMIAVGHQATKETAIALENWILDQTRIAKMIASDQRVVNACENPGNSKYTVAAQQYINSIGKRFPFYENIPLISKMDTGQTVPITVHGEVRMVGDGQFFMDTVDGKTIGKCSPKASFIDAIYRGKEYFISKVYPSLLRGNPIFVISVPVKNSRGELVGVTMVAPQMSYFTDLFVNSVNVGETGHLIFIDDRGMILSHPDQKLILNKEMVKTLGNITRRVFDGETYFTENFSGEKFSYISRSVNLSEDKILHKWYMLFSQEHNEIMENSRHFLKILAGTSLVFLVLFGGGLFLLCLIIVEKPVNQTVAALKDIAEGEGDLTRRIEVKSADEIGELALWFNIFLEKQQKLIQQLGRNSTDVDSSSGELLEMAIQMAEEADSTMSMAGTISMTTEKMNESFQEVARSTGHAADNVAMVATAAEEMTSTINEIASNVQNASTISNSAVLKASDASDQIADLGKAAQLIGNVVETINDISEQVNLLALNATIEAARAGDAGKGFAVVANEIKGLAGQTATATMEIKESIGNIRDLTSNTVDGVTDISQIITTVNDIVETIASAVEEQSSATKETSENISLASQAITEVRKNIDDIVPEVGKIAGYTSTSHLAAEKISSISNSVKTNAGELQTMAGGLNAIVGTFKV